LVLICCCERQNKWRLEVRDGKMELALRAVGGCKIAGIDLSLLLIVIPILIQLCTFFYPAVGLCRSTPSQLVVISRELQLKNMALQLEYKDTGPILE